MNDNNNLDNNNTNNNLNNNVEPVLPVGNATSSPIETPVAPMNVNSNNQIPVSETPIVHSNENVVNQTPIENVMPQTLVNQTKNDNQIIEKPKRKHHFLRSFFSLLITLAFCGWICILAYDFYNITTKAEPKFCIEKGTIKNEDGTIDWCLGAGYKTYHYDYEEYEAYEFGPFWQEAKTLEEIKNK